MSYFIAVFSYCVLLYHTISRINSQLVAELLPAAAVGNFSLVCGPNGFVEGSCIPALTALNYSDENHTIVRF